jgi:anaerobic selenocysteine-containing dehydrogenase
MEPVSRSGEAGPWRPWTQGIEREDLIRIHPVTAAALGIENGDEVLVSSPEGSWEAFAWINRCVPEGVVSAPGRVGGKSVLVQRKDRTREETLNLLMELIP